MNAALPMTFVRCYIKYGGDGRFDIGCTAEGAGITSPQRGGGHRKRTGGGRPLSGKTWASGIRGPEKADHQFDLFLRQFCYDR